MKLRQSGQRLPLVAAFLIPLLAFILACGPGQEPTPTPTATQAPAATATPTPAPIATPTAATGPAATPTPTTAPLPAPSPTGKRGGVLEIGHTAELAHYDIQILASGGNPDLAPVYTNLFFTPERDVFVCEICVDEQWQIENAGKTLVVNIRPGIKFHNGQEMTAGDVKYSLEKMMGEIDGVVSARCGLIKEYLENIQAPSRYVLRINLLRPSPFVPKALAMNYCAIYPAGTTRAQLQTAPNGAGPFLLKERVPGSHVKFERNPNYFKPGLPYLDGITVRKVSDANSAAAAFLGHRLDISGAPRTYRAQFEKVAATGTIVGVKIPEPRTYGMGMMVAKPPFDNLKLRQAVALAIDRTEFGEAIYDNDYLGEVLFGPDSEWGRPESEIWDVVPGFGRGAKKQQEIEQAKRLAVEAGYPTGLDTEQMSRATDIAIMELLGAHLGKIGIRTKITPATSIVRDSRLQNGDWALSPAGITISSGDPDEVLAGSFVTGGSRNWFFYNSKEIDQLIAQQSSESDPVKRKQLIRQIEDIIVLKDVVTAPLVLTYNYTYWYAYVNGYKPGGFAQANGGGPTRKEFVWLDRAGQ